MSLIWNIALAIVLAWIIIISIPTILFLLWVATGLIVNSFSAKPKRRP